MTSFAGHETEHLMRLLIRRRSQLLNEVGQVLPRSGEHSYTDLVGGVPDAGDESVASTLSRIYNAIVARHFQEICDIEAAVKRVDEVGFGICADCGNEIRYRQLLVCPTAKRCAACQARHEKSYAHAW